MSISRLHQGWTFKCSWLRNVMEAKAWQWRGGLEGKRRGWCVAEGRPGDGGAGQWILFVIYRRSSGCICTAGLVVGGYDDYEWRCWWWSMISLWLRVRLVCIRLCACEEWVSWDFIRAFLHVSIRADTCARRKHELNWTHSRQSAWIAANRIHSRQPTTITANRIHSRRSTSIGKNRIHSRQPKRN